MSFSGSAASASGTGAAGTVVSNLPWGLRSRSSGDLRNLYAALGNVCRSRLPGWGLAVLVADMAMARQIRPRMASSLSLEVSGVRAWLMTTTKGLARSVRGETAPSAARGKVDCTAQ